MSSLSVNHSRMLLSKSHYTRPAHVCCLYPSPNVCGARIQHKGGMLRRRERQNGRTKTILEAGSRSEPKTASRVNVVEYFVLFQFEEDTETSHIEKVLSDLWSLKYTVPNVLCASAGAIYPLEQKSSSQKDDFEGCTHAVKFRFASQRNATQFQTHPKFVEVTSAVQAESFCTGAIELVAQVMIPNELQNIFKSGGTWDVGVEHVILMANESAPGALSAMTDLAVSSAGGAMQSGSGSAVILSSSSPTSEEKIIVSHFLSGPEAASFTKSPPVTTLLEPSRGVRQFCFEIVPADSKSQKTGKGGLL